MALLLDDVFHKVYSDLKVNNSGELIDALLDIEKGIRHEYSKDLAAFFIYVYCIGAVTGKVTVKLK